MQYRVYFAHSIERYNESSYTSQSMNESSTVVSANSINEAERMVTAMYGGYQNCQVKSVQQL
jgi:hypothetical protein